MAYKQEYRVYEWSCQFSDFNFIKNLQFKLELAVRIGSQQKVPEARVSVKSVPFNYLSQLTPIVWSHKWGEKRFNKYCMKFVHVMQRGAETFASIFFDIF